MSNLFSGKPPSSGGGSNGNGKDDGQEKSAFSFSRPASGAGNAATSAAAPRPPLFPPREGQSTPGTSFGSRSVDDGKAPVAPLFPRREPVAPAAGAPRAPLFPRPAAPAAPGSSFPDRSAEAGKVPAAPLFPRRDPAVPGSTSYGHPGTSAVTAPGQTPSSFSSRLAPPAAPPRPSYGGAPAAPVFTPPSAPGTPVLGRETKIADEEFIQLRDFLYQQSGIYIAENRKYLVENRLASRLRELGLRSFGEYYKYLRYDANRSTEMNKLFESMTTNETSFFRNQPQLDVFRDKVLIKTLNDLRAKGQKKLRIWSAGCSSGEEPYTIAMILHEVLKQELGSWDIKITANDLSLAMLAAARRGVYNDYAIRTTPPDMLARYFTKEGSLYRIDPKLQQLVSFSQINLSDKVQLQKVERSQIVFCRNVIIYFDDEMKRNVINAYYDNLLPGGYLIIGHSESLHNISRAFKPEHYTGSIIYCKQN